ncbi:hypothetical protein PLICRDRAFT_50441 [Plicaturopsis crispa FD-325 SS-3]|nr:hypothetical protein PLICRDRAFT_50441 [Plicaturopsis crispa FD-325 SS-3]
MPSFTFESTARLSSGYDIPLLGFGVFQNNDAKPSVAEALRVGYTHIDSAQMYKNEAQVGDAVRESGIDRSDLFITSKILGVNQGYERTLASVEESLDEFDFDYLDLFLIHDPKPGKEKRLATYRALLEKRDEGKIRSVGVSNYGVRHLEEIREAGLELPAVNQIELHPRCQQKSIVAYCRAHNILVQAYSPIMRGNFDEPIIQKLAKKYSKEPAQILLRWSLQKGYNPLVKSATPARIQSNVQLYDFNLSNEDMAQLDSLDRGDKGALLWNPVSSL